MTKASEEYETTFPEYQRVIFEKNPLEMVVAELRFSPLLRITGEIPIYFQEDIKDTYPELSEGFEKTFPSSQLNQMLISLNIVPDENAINSNLITNKMFMFSSADGSWKVTLTNSKIALTTNKYKRWEDFNSRFDAIFRSLCKHYAIKAVKRIGLRYQDIINPKMVLTKEEIEKGNYWTNLLSQNVSAELGSELSSLMEVSSRDSIIKLKSIGKVRIRHGLATHSSSPSEKVFMLDSDFYLEEEKEIGDVARILRHFNGQAGRLFKWCISQELFHRLQPQNP